MVLIRDVGVAHVKLVVDTFGMVEGVIPVDAIIRETAMQQPEHVPIHVTLMEGVITTAVLRITVVATYVITSFLVTPVPITTIRLSRFT